ncbi:hypothetical protein MUP77_01315 [Candidatus Bathyarchaeota archaeon]|nr:hypothetical protein [Candidatus Bathyarchaeota archaeon]
MTIKMDKRIESLIDTTMGQEIRENAQEFLELLESIDNVTLTKKKAKQEPVEPEWPTWEIVTKSMRRDPRTHRFIRISKLKCKECGFETAYGFDALQKRHYRQEHMKQ